MNSLRFFSLLLLCILTSSYGIHAEVPHNAETLEVYVVPGLSGGSGRKEYVQHLLEQPCLDDIHMTMPPLMHDLGQGLCLRELRTMIAANPASCALIHATSQGTATTLNYVAYENKDKCVKGLILESVLISGNAAIEHTLQGPRMNQGRITALPFSYYWMPYIVQLVRYQAYFPAGKQPIKAASRIPNDLLVIIVHSEDDERLSYVDACALYYGLRAQGNNNVYLISKPGTQHHCLVDDEADKNVVRTILKKHGLIEGEADQSIDLSQYQPDPAPFKERYEAILEKEKMHEMIAYSVLAIVIALIARLIFFK